MFRSFVLVRAERKLGQITSDTTTTVNATCKIAGAIFVASFATTVISLLAVCNHSYRPSRKFPQIFLVFLNLRFVNSSYVETLYVIGRVQVDEDEGDTVEEVPSQPALVPSQPALVPSQPALVPSQSALVPSQPALVPSQPALVP